MSIKHTIKKCLGSFFQFFYPKRKQQLLAGAAHWNDGSLSLVDRLTLWSNFIQGNATDHRDLSRYHNQYWSGERSHSWFEAFGNRFSKKYLQHNKTFLYKISEMISDKQSGIKTLCELGTASGDAIEYFYKQSHGVLSNYIGLDVNDAQIQDNRERFKEVPIAFETASAQNWLANNIRPGIFLFAFGGVMEYLSREDTEAIYQQLSENAPASIALLEPLKEGYDYSIIQDSIVHGGELTLLHPHMALLKKYGFTIVHEHVTDGLMLELIAVKPAG